MREKLCGYTDGKEEYMNGKVKGVSGKGRRDLQAMPQQTTPLLTPPRYCYEELDGDKCIRSHVCSQPQQVTCAPPTLPLLSPISPPPRRHLVTAAFFLMCSAMNYAGAVVCVSHLGVTTTLDLLFTFP